MFFSRALFRHIFAPIPAFSKAHSRCTHTRFCL